MDKYLATSNLSVEKLTYLEVFNHIRSNFFFDKENNPTSSIITFYTILTDGKEVIIYENAEKEVDIGLPILERKISSTPSLKKSPEYFDELMIEVVLQGIKLYFPEIKTRVCLNINDTQQLDKAIGDETPLLDRFINFHSTNRAFFSLDKRRVYVTCFVTVPNTRLIKLLPASKDQFYYAIYWNDLTRTGLAKYKLSPVAKNILVMVGVGDIVLPVITDSGDCIQ